MMNPIKKQSGAILIVSLLILLILTVLGLSSMQSSVMQEKMTAAVRENRVALEGAEAGLHYVETEVIEGLATTSGFDSSGCLYAEGEGPRQDINGLWPANTWTTGSCEAVGVNKRATATVGGADGSLAENPRYFIELQGTLQNEDATNIMIFNYNNNAGAGAVTGFKVVVRSRGASDSSQKIVAGFYGKRI